MGDMIVKIFNMIFIKKKVFRYTSKQREKMPLPRKKLTYVDGREIEWNEPALTNSIWAQVKTISKRKFNTSLSIHIFLKANIKRRARRSVKLPGLDFTLKKKKIITSAVKSWAIQICRHKSGRSRISRGGPNFFSRCGGPHWKKIIIDSCTCTKSNWYSNCFRYNKRY